jgi:hypothetical protein
VSPAGGCNCTSGSRPMARFHITGAKPPGSAAVVLYMYRWNCGMLETAEFMDGILMSGPRQVLAYSCKVARH